MHNKVRVLDLLAKHLTIREAKEKAEAEQREREDLIAKYATDEYWEERDRIYRILKHQIIPKTRSLILSIRPLTSVIINK